MNLRRAWSAAILAAAVSAPCFGAGEDELPQPQTPCSHGAGNCYSDPELTNVANVIAVKDDDVPIIHAVLTHPYPVGADVHYPDVQGVAGYFHNEQGIRDGLEDVLIKYGHYTPDQVKTLMQQPMQVRPIVQGLIKSGQLPRSYLKENIGPYWHGGRATMQDIIAAKGPFVMALNNAKNDPLVPMMMKPLGKGGDTLPPVTTPSQLQQSQPNNPEAYVDGAQAAAADGDLQGAANQASQALALDPNNVQALDIRGAANFQLGNKDDARADATTALKINPNDQTANAILNLADHVGSSDLKSPADPFKATPAGMSSLADGVASHALWNDGGAGSAGLAAAKNPQSGSLLREAVGELSLGDSAAAQAKLDKIIALDPADVAALNLRAMALARQRRYAEALQDAESVLRLDPKNQAAMDTRSVALNKLKRFAEAAAQARAAIALNPNDPNAYRNLAEALAGLGDRSGSLAALRKAAELDARYQPLLETALRLPADADLNLLFADDAPAAAAVAAARGAASPRRKWDFGFIAAAGAVGLALLLVGLLPLYSRRIKDAWRKFSRCQVVRASEVQYIEALIKGKYRLGTEIAGGDMGIVYEGFDTQLQRPVAIKRIRDEIRANAREHARFVSEAKLAAAVRHTNIADIYAISDEGDGLYLVTEYVDGKTLQELVSARGRLSLDEALPILRGAAAAVEFAHGRGIIHRDLKPSNIMIDKQGTVKVVDFGVAGIVKNGYVAPEQEKGLVRKESDVFALGACLYELLTGRPPFSGTGAGMLMNKLDKAFAPASTLAPDLPPGVDPLLSAALDPDPAKRIGSARDLLARLEAAAASRR